MRVRPVVEFAGKGGEGSGAGVGVRDDSQFSAEAPVLELMEDQLGGALRPFHANPLCQWREQSVCCGPVVLQDPVVGRAVSQQRAHQQRKQSCGPTPAPKVSPHQRSGLNLARQPVCKVKASKQPSHSFPAHPNNIKGFGRFGLLVLLVLLGQWMSWFGF